MTKYNDFFMLAGKDRRVIAKRASRHVRNRFGYAAVNRNKIQDVPAENRGKNRFCHMAARKHRFEPAEMKKPQPAPVYGLLAGREKRMIGSVAPKMRRNGFSRVALKGNVAVRIPAKGNDRNRFSLNVRIEPRGKKTRPALPSEGFFLLAGRDRRLSVRPAQKRYSLLVGRERRLMSHPHRKQYRLLAGRDRRLPVRSPGKQYRLLGGRSRHFRTIWLPKVSVIEVPRRIVPVPVAKRDLAVIGGRPYGWIRPLRSFDESETLIGG